MRTSPRAGSNGQPGKSVPFSDPEVIDDVEPAKARSASPALTEHELREKVLTERAPEFSREEEGGGLHREDWFYFQRAYPAMSIPIDAGVKMVETLERQEAQLLEDRAMSAQAAQAIEQQMIWAPIGPQPIIGGRTLGAPRNNVSGRVSAIALDPRYNGTSNQTVYVGGAQGGVWKSTDNGVNFTPITDSQPSLATGAIAVDPVNPETVYVGTGEGSRCALCYYGAGLLKSTDGGTSWSVISGPISQVAPIQPVFNSAAFTRIAIDPVNTRTIYACTTFGQTATANSSAGQIQIGQVGVWKSTDGGQNWRNLDPGGTNGTFSAHDFIIDPQNPNRVFAGMRTIGIFRSEQGGEPGTWQRLTNGLPDVGADPTGNPSTSPFRRMAMASGPPIAPSTSTTLYIAFAANNDNLLGIWRSTDAGNTWTKMTTPQDRGQAGYNLDIAVDPGDANVVYYATSVDATNLDGTLHRSADGGQTWRSISQGDGLTGGLHVDSHQIVVSPANPNILFTGNDGGIWRTNNAKANIVSWTQLNNTMNITQFMSIALHPTDPDIVIGGTQDNGTNRFRGNLAWDHVADGDGGFALIDQSNPQVMYHTFFNQSNSGGQDPVIGPEVSLNGGDRGTWILRGCFSCSAIQGNFNPSDRVAFYAPMALNTGFTGANGNVVYFGTNRIYRSANRAITWTGLGASTDGFGQDLTKGSGVITTIAAHPTLNNNSAPPGEIVWAGTSDGNIQVTTTAGALATATFTNVAKAPLPNRFVTDIALDPNNTQRAVAAYSGFNTNTAATPGHVFLTTDLGASWQNISGDLPDVPVTSVALNPNSANTIYIGTDLGVFQTTNGGANWVRLGNGMPRIATFMVRYQASTNILFAATHGRGIFKLTTARAQTTVSAANFSAASVASEAIVAAFGTGMATTTLAAATLPLPTNLAGTRVAVIDSSGAERLAPLFFVSSGQVNFQIPPGTVAGPATINITSGDGTVSSGTAQIELAAPSLFAANANGKDAPAGFALRAQTNGNQTNLPINRFDATQNRFVTEPIDLGSPTDQVFAILYGTGIRFRSSLANVSATIGGEPAQVQYAGLQGDFVGLDQVNILIPRSLAGRGEVDVVLIVDGRQANTLRLNFK